MVLPLTIISFGIFTKWWYVEIDGEFHEFLTGFPLPYYCPGWHTSLSYQIFILAFIIDLLAYFIFWFFVVYFINRFIKNLEVSGLILIILFSVSILFTALGVLKAINSDNIYTFEKEFESVTLKSVYKFSWEKKPDLRYDLTKK